LDSNFITKLLNDQLFLIINKIKKQLITVLNLKRLETFKKKQKIIEYFNNKKYKTNIHLKRSNQETFTIPLLLLLLLKSIIIFNKTFCYSDFLRQK
jgi:hypothetical protein